MRSEFNKDTRREAYDRSRGICECHRVPQLKRPKGCGCDLGPGNTYYEHIIQDGAGGRPDLDNCAVLTKTCWREKTSLHDQPKVAEVKRQRDKLAINARPPSKHPVPGGRRTPFKRTMYRGTVRRES